MNNEELTRGAAALISLRQAAVAFDESFRTPEMAVKGLQRLLNAVDGLKATARPEPYIPVVGETVTIQGTVLETYNEGATVVIEFGPETWNRHTVNPRLVVVRPA